MTAFRFNSALAASWLAACLVLVAMSGCGSPPPQGEKKDNKTTDPPLSIGPGSNPNPGTGPGTTPSPPPKNTLGEVEPAADQAATAFLTSLAQGNARAESLSTTFMKVVGKPVALPSDKSQGYSADEATAWLRRVGEGISIGLPLTRPKQSGSVVYMRGSFTGPRLGNDPSKTGGYSLRLVKEGDEWKVDWLVLSSVEVTTTAVAATPEAAAQEFAVTAFVEAIADLNGMGVNEQRARQDRAPLIAAALTNELRAALAPPFDGDKLQGYDFSPTTISTVATKIGGGTISFTMTRIGDLPEYRVSLTKLAGKQHYTVRLAKAGLHDWLVNEIVEAKE